MGFAIQGYQDDLRKKIDQYSDTLALIQGTASPIEQTGGVSGSAWGGTGVSASAIKDAKATDVFSAAARHGGNTTTASQSNNTQTNMSNATTAFNDFVTNVKNQAVNTLTNIIQQLDAQLNSLNGADSSAIASNPTSGQSVKPQDNMPTDNQSSDEKAGTPSDSNKPNVSFGEESVTDTSETKETEGSKDPAKTEREESTQQAQTSAELDKAAQKETEKQAEIAQQKIQQEAAKMRNLFSQA